MVHTRIHHSSVLQVQIGSSYLSLDRSFFLLAAFLKGVQIRASIISRLQAIRYAKIKYNLGTYSALQTDYT